LKKLTYNGVEGGDVKMEQRSEKSIVEKLLNQAMNTSTYFLCFNKQNKKWEVKTTKSLNTLLKITLIFNPNE